jgi:HlyD family secretion protein
MKKKLIGLGLIGLVLLLGGYLLFFQESRINVETGRVVQGDIYQFVEETGMVQAEDLVGVYALTGGSFNEVLKEVGDPVKTGDVLAQMDNREVLLQIKALEAQQQSANARYREIIKPTDQDTVKKLTALLRSAEAYYQEAERQAANNKDLYDSGAVSLDSYQNSLAMLAQAKASVEAARSDLALAQKGASDHVQKEMQGQIDQIQAQIDLLKKQSTDLIIKAPIDGLVLAKEIKPGSFVQPGTLLFEIGSTQDLFLESDILLDKIGAVTEGAEVLINNEDFDISDLKGRVWKIHPRAFSKISELGIEQKRVRVEIEFSDVKGILKPGYEVDLKILTGSKEGALLIDKKAVFNRQDQNYVFVVENQQAVLKEIETGIESGDLVEVLQGLREGEEIILSPDQTVEAGKKVQSQSVS